MNSRMIPMLLLAVGGLGGWLLHEVRSPQAFAQEAPVAPTADPKPAEPAAEAEHPLDTLDWLVGDWVVASEKYTIEFNCQFTKNRAFLIRSFRVLEGDSVKQSGLQLIGWDASLETIRSWTYDAEGGFGEEIWSQTESRYTLRCTYTLPDGLKGASLNTLTYVDNSTCTWKSVNREIGGELQPDVDEFTLVRKSQPEEPKVVEPKKEEK